MGDELPFGITEGDGADARRRSARIVRRGLWEERYVGIQAVDFSPAALQRRIVGCAAGSGSLRCLSMLVQLRLQALLVHVGAVQVVVQLLGLLHREPGG